MFGFIKNLFGGIFGFLGRLLGLKKSEYFLDLDSNPGKEPAKAEPAKAQSLVAVAAPAKVETASSKPKKPEPTPKPAVASTNGKVPIQAAPAITFSPNYLMPTPTANRRLPGANMNNFRDMARQMKTTK